MKVSQNAKELGYPVVGIETVRDDRHVYEWSCIHDLIVFLWSQAIATRHRFPPKEDQTYVRGHTVASAFLCRPMLFTLIAFRDFSAFLFSLYGNAVNVLTHH